LTFTGLDLLVLATVNGSINLTSDVSFQGLNELAMYARGAGSNLILNSPISNIGILELAAEGSIHLTNPGTMSVGEFEATAGNNLTLQIGSSLLLDGKNHLDTLVLPGTTLANGANVAVNITGDYTNNSTTDSSRLRVKNEGAHIGTGGNIGVNIGGNLTAMNVFSLVVQNTNGQIDNGGNITLNVNGNVSTQGQLSLLVENYDDSGNPSGHIGTGGNISLTTGQQLNVSSINALIDNSSGGQISTGGDLSFTTGSDLASTGAATFTIRNTTGTINNGGNITLDVGDNLSAQGQLNLLVENYDFSANPAGHIGTGGNISVTTGAGLTADSISDVINNRNGSTIGSSVNLTLNVGGALTTLHNGTDYFGESSSLSLFISNRYDNTLGSTIGGNATLGLSADSASIGGNLNAIISNRAGTIDGNALLSFATLHDFTIHGDASWEILVGRDAISPVGGTIHGNATIQLSAANLSGNSLFVYLDNRDGGRIDSAATIDFNLTGDVTTPGDASFEIANQRHPGFGGPTGGSIGGDATLTIAAASFSVGGGLDADIFNLNNSAAASGAGGSIGGNATVILNIPGNISVTSDFNAGIANQRAAGTALGPSGGFIGSNATVDITAGALSVGGTLTAEIRNRNNGSGSGIGGTIGGSAAVNFNADNTVSSGSAAYFQIVNDGVVAGSPGGSIGGDATIDVNVGSLTSGPDQFSNAWVVQIDNTSGTVGGNATVNFAAAGSVNAQGNAFLQILNFNGNGSGGGTIGGDAALSISAASISTAGFLYGAIDNSSGGSITGSADVTFTLTGDLTTQGDATFRILNNDGGQIGGDANLLVTTQSDGNFSANSIDAEINNRNGGMIGSSAEVNFNIGGTLTTEGDAIFAISNRNDGSGGGVINDDVTIELTAASVSIGGGLLTDISTNRGGHIASAFNHVSAGSTLMAQSYLDFEIENAGFLLNNTFLPGGTIDSDATLDLRAGNMSTVIDYVNAGIFNDGGGHIGGNATINVVASGGINAATDAFFTITNNQNDQGPPAGTIGGDAAINVTATNISTGGGLFAAIDNSGGGSIGGNADLGFSLTGNLATQGDAIFTIDNSNGGTIGGNATIDVTATNITANSLTAQIVNTGGSIGASNEGGATINMNVSNSATVTGDATAAIYGSDGAGSAEINIHAGNYNVGGTFLSYIDGNGTITFTNATAHADVLKAGVFGANGVLNIGGGMLSADTELKLYAPGSNGSLNFMSNVTLDGNAVKILAANSITIFNNIVVTINGPAAQVYTNNANYTGSGGNGTTTGTFAGAGANNPQPLASAPPFGPSSPSHPTVTTPRNVANRDRNHNTINVNNTDQLLALLDGATAGPDGKVTVPASRNTRDLRNSSRTDINALPREARRILMQQIRDRSITRVGNRRIL